MPGQQNTVLFEVRGAATAAAGSPSPPGMDGGGGAATDGSEKEKTGFIKKMKNVPKQIASFSKSSLGVQFSLAAMLRQSQIATGFLSAMFQVLGAIMDSFLVAFAPSLFGAIAGMAKLIPVARKIGEEMVGSVNDVRERLRGLWMAILPVLQGMWAAVKAVGGFLLNLPQGMKTLAIIALVGAKLLNVFSGQLHYVRLQGVTYSATLKALTVWGARTAGSGAGKLAGGGASLVGMMPIAAIVTAVLAVGIGALMSRGGDKDKSQGVDVAGQLGRKYLPSQASRLGTDLNTLMSDLNPTFQAMVDATNPVNEALTSMAANIDGEIDKTVLAYLKVQEGMDGTEKALQNHTKGILENTLEFTSKWGEMATDLRTGVVDRAVADYLIQQEAMTLQEASIYKVTAALDAMYAGMPISKTPTEAKKDIIDSSLASQLSNFGGGAGSGTNSFVEALNTAKETANLNRDIAGQLSMFSEGMSYIDKEKAKDPVVRRIDQGIQSQLSMYQETANLERGLLRIAENEAEERKREHQENLAMGNRMAAAMGNMANF